MASLHDACRLANLERFTKRQEQVSAPEGTPQNVERLLKEESYIKSRLDFVRQVLLLAPSTRGLRQCTLHHGYAMVVAYHVDQLTPA